MTAVAGLIAVIIKIVLHFLKNKTPEARKNYVKNLESYAEALLAGDADAVNAHWNDLREDAIAADPERFNSEKTSQR